MDVSIHKINLLHADFFSGNIDMNLHFITFIPPEMRQDLSYVMKIKDLLSTYFPSAVNIIPVDDLVPQGTRVLTVMELILFAQNNQGPVIVGQ